MIRTILQLTLIPLAWISLAFMAYKNDNDRSSFWYIILLPFAILLFAAVMMGLIMFVSWVY